MPKQSISINRAPVLTLWAVTVAQRLGFNEDEAWSLGKALAGLTAQTKGRRLGIFKPKEDGALQDASEKAWLRRRSRQAILVGDNLEYRGGEKTFTVAVWQSEAL
jgi:hypothetical protein